MSKIDYSRRTNRNITYNAPRVANYAYLYSKLKPTDKQVAFYNKLYAICKTNGVETCRHAGTRASYSFAIDTMVGSLIKAGLWKSEKPA